MVQIRPHFRPSRSSCSSAWCAQVTVVPEVSRISVLSSGRCQGSKVSMPFGGHTPPISSVRATWCRSAGNSARREIGPEPGDEEHHLGGDEQDHAVAVRDLHHAGVIALVLGFLDDVAPPADHRVEHAERAGGEHQRRRGEHLVHPGDQRRPRGRRPRPSRRSATGSDRPDDSRGAWRARRPSSLLRSLSGAPESSSSPISPFRDPRPAWPARAPR